MTGTEFRSYSRVWSAFQAIPETADGRHDTAYWRSHTSPFALCVIRVPVESIQPELDTLRAELTEMHGIRLHPDHFLHITLQEFGFVTDEPEQADEISAGRLEEFAHAAADALSGLASCTIDLGGANSFQDAAFLQVGNTAHLTQLHERLFELAAIPRVPTFPFLPHCTVAHYNGETPPRAAAEAIMPWRSIVFGTFVAEEVEIVTLDPSEPYPQLASYAAIPFGCDSAAN